MFSQQFHVYICRYILRKIKIVMESNFHRIARTRVVRWCAATPQNGPVGPTAGLPKGAASGVFYIFKVKLTTSSYASFDPLSQKRPHTNLFVYRWRRHQNEGRCRAVSIGKPRLATTSGNSVSRDVKRHVYLNYNDNMTRIAPTTVVGLWSNKTAEYQSGWLVGLQNP